MKTDGLDTLDFGIISENNLDYFFRCLVKAFGPKQIREMAKKHAGEGVGTTTLAFSPETNTVTRKLVSATCSLLSAKDDAVIWGVFYTYSSKPWWNHRIEKLFFQLTPPSKDCTWESLFAQIDQDWLECGGHFFLWTVKNMGGLVSEVMRLPPDRVSVKEDGSFVVRMNDTGSYSAYLKADEVITFVPQPCKPIPKIEAAAPKKIRQYCQGCWHYRNVLGQVECGADYPNVSCTQVFKNVTCPECLAKFNPATTADLAHKINHLPKEEAEKEVSSYFDRCKEAIANSTSSTPETWRDRPPLL